MTKAQECVNLSKCANPRRAYYKAMSIAAKFNARLIWSSINREGYHRRYRMEDEVLHFQFADGSLVEIAPSHVRVIFPDA